ncbi:MAG TPA: hypothetical protein VJG31_01975 [Candidatus Nanoarchaeia archaeon]|nr:hypothetical protein [Candidatus Nanoarchaeia archaeon]
MELKNETWRKDAVALMKEIVKPKQERLANQLSELLTPVEKSVHQFVRDLSFQEGAWYRPAHNIIVPAAMISICTKENCPRDLVYAALLHDAGNSLMVVADTTKGADWENPDKRYKHMQLGSIMTSTALLYARSQGLEIDLKRIPVLADIVATHDYPYLGRELTTPEELAHRDADRVFVPSSLSWYKDLIAHASDAKYLDKAKAFGMEINPEHFLLCRLAFFYKSEVELPGFENQKNLHLSSELATYNEGGKTEPPYTPTAKEMIDEMFVRRASELETVKGCSLKQFGNLFENAFVSEIENLLARAKE